jgi:hypothetical protein
MTNVTRQQVLAALLADASPFNAYHRKDIWINLLVSFCILPLG